MRLSQLKITTAQFSTCQVTPCEVTVESTLAESRGQRDGRDLRVPGSTTASNLLGEVDVGQFGLEVGLNCGNWLKQVKQFEES